MVLERVLSVMVGAANGRDGSFVNVDRCGDLLVVVGHGVWYLEKQASSYCEGVLNVLMVF